MNYLWITQITSNYLNYLQITWITSELLWITWITSELLQLLPNYFNYFQLPLNYSNYLNYLRITSQLLELPSNYFPITSNYLIIGISFIFNLRTEVADVYSESNMKYIRNGEYKIFGAGLRAEKHKNSLYASGRCEELLNDGYHFIPNASENMGGISRIFQKICNDWLRIKIGNKGIARDKLSLWKNNWWIEYQIQGYGSLQYINNVQNIVTIT